ncbi:MAG: alpha/beta hydrolase [Oscillospiraceae bacterium]|nr:alpha/beta hydrolase [Oscillospiraceae bacterium]
MKRSLPTRIRELCNTYRPNEYMLKPYLLKDGKPHPVAILCPGGGYRRVCDFIEGHPYAKKLNQMGYHAIVVFYRVRNLAVYPNPQDDLARAVRDVFSHAEDWKLDMEGYSIWGSSAGGHLAGSFGTEAMGYIKYGLPKPGALVLVYPVVTMGEKTHPGSRNYHIGAYAAQEYIDLASIEKQVTANYPPTFLWWGDCDGTVDPDNSRMLQKALEEHHIPCLCREYQGVDHGIGIGKGLPCEGWFEDAVAFWESQRKK